MRWWPLAIAGVLLVAFFVAGRLVDVDRHVETAQGWTAALGSVAPAAYVAVYVVVTLLGGPGLPFTLLSPLLFGVGPAIVVMVVASAASAALAFLIARHFARDTLARRLGRTEGFARVSALVEAHDWAVIPAVRILPLAPFAVVNYGFGLTRVGFWRYFLWTELAMVPANVVQVAGAGLIFDAAARGAASWPLLAAAAACALALLALGVRGRRTLART